MQSRTRRACIGVALVAVLAAVATALALATHAGAAGSESNYLVVYSAQSVPSNTAAASAPPADASSPPTARSVWWSRRSSTPTFRATFTEAPRSRLSPKRRAFATQLDPARRVDSSEHPRPRDAPAPGERQPVRSLQWDMDQIHAPEARAINGGSPSIVVGDIDTGLDYTHPDLAANVD